MNMAEQDGGPTRRLRVVLAGSECVPFAKTGGLADVIGALPGALASLGHEVQVFLPCYRRSWTAGPSITSTGLTVHTPIGDHWHRAVIRSSHLPGTTVPVYLIDAPEFFDRDQLYQDAGHDFADNCGRFIFFQKAVLEAIRHLDLRPDVIHCHDWQTGLIPSFIDEFYRGFEEFSNVGTLFTIHNIAYQGSFWSRDMQLTGLPAWQYNPSHLEAYGRLNFLKAGIAKSDLLNTVSPTYAREIQSGQGEGLDGLLRARSGDLSGIVNGIDTLRWNPRLDPSLITNYDETTLATGKAACKAALQRRASLPERPDVPLFAQIGRLASQKGWDLLAAVAREVLKFDVQLIVLGEGEPRYHEMLDFLGNDFPDKVRAFLMFNDLLAHQIEAGADIFLMPSLYEPCGLNQLYSLAYGTVPIVRATGGLADTVVDVDPRSMVEGRATGFVFREPTPRGLRAAIERAATVWHDRRAWNALAANGMRADWSWDRSARSYVELYQEILRRRGRA